MPILAFVLVFVVVYAVLVKSKIFGDNNFIYSIISLVVSLIFILTPGARQFITTSTPALIVFLVSSFFLLFIVGFVHGDIKDIVKETKFGQIALVIVLLIFLVSAIMVFGPVLEKFTPWGSDEGLSTSGSHFKSFIFHPSVLGVIALFLVAAAVAWAVNR